MRPKVSVYITCHNYGQYVTQAIDSVFYQLFEDWELLIIDDGSSDNSLEIIKNKAKAYPDKVRVISNKVSKGLPVCANIAIEESKGEYIIRLDADDFFDESAILTMSTFLDKHKEISLVYPNYVYVDECGNYLGTERRKKIGHEVKVLDLPAHGACTMVRKRVLKSIGGYDTEHNAQDGHQIWLKILNRYKISNITTPLFFYRQHKESLTTDNQRILSARKNIKRSMVKKHKGSVSTHVVGVIPAKNIDKSMPNICLNKIGGKPLIDYSIEAAMNSSLLDDILISTDDQLVVDYCSKKFANIKVYLRPKGLSERSVMLPEVMLDATNYLEDQLNISLDIVVMLNVLSPLRVSSDIDEAVDTLLLYDVDSVTSVYEDHELHFTHGKFGLEPLNKGAMNQIFLERESLFVDNNSVKAFWRDVLSSDTLHGMTYGHFVMPKFRSYRIQDKSTFCIIENLIKTL
jgi:CMP-N-acetylneuraminic acid synthetase